MTEDKKILWILHYKPENYGVMQYAFTTISDVSYGNLFDTIGCHVASVHGIISYSRGKKAPHTIIKGGLSLALAKEYFGNVAYTEGIHLKYTLRHG